MICFAISGAGASEPRVNPIQRAIHEAEDELRRVEGNASEWNGGWSIGDYLGLAAFVAAVGLMLWVARLVKKSAFSGRAGGQMRILERLSLGRNSSVVVVRLRGNDYLLAEHPSGIALLEKLPPEPEQRQAKDETTGHTRQSGDNLPQPSNQEKS